MKNYRKTSSRSTQKPGFTYTFPTLNGKDKRKRKQLHPIIGTVLLLDGKFNIVKKCTRQGTKMTPLCHNCANVRLAKEVFCKTHVARGKPTYSLAACQFIDALEKEWGFVLHHRHVTFRQGQPLIVGSEVQSRSPTHQRTDTFYLDACGYKPDGTKVIVEFFGTYWHNKYETEAYREHRFQTLRSRYPLAEIYVVHDHEVPKTLTNPSRFLKKME